MSKILQISPFSFTHPGGVEQYAKVLQELFPDEMETLAGGEDFPIIEVVKHFPFPAFWKREFWKIFRDKNFFLIVSHIRFAPTSWLAYYIARKKKIPYVHVEHGTGFLIHKNPFIAWVAKMVDLTIGKYIIRKADYVICVSEAGKAWVTETFGRKKNISVIYRGFEFPKVERKINEVPKIGFVGRLTGLKNVSGLIETLAEIRDEKCTLEIVGDGEERENLENLTKTLHLEDRIRFHGAKPHDWIMSEFYPTVDIFINPSLQEGLPTTVIEALGMGCQVIATDVGGTRGIRGITLIPSHDEQALREQIEEMLQTENISSKYEHQFSFEQMKNDYQIIFSEFAGAGMAK